MTHQQILNSLFDIFDFQFSMAEIYRLRSRTCQFYQESYQNIINKLLHGNILHADETEIKLKKYKGYVWVFSNMEEVIYMYKWL
jgi:hypothetical protein